MLLDEASHSRIGGGEPSSEYAERRPATARAAAPEWREWPA